MWKSVDKKIVNINALMEDNKWSPVPQHWFHPRYGNNENEIAKVKTMLIQIIHCHDCPRLGKNTEATNLQSTQCPIMVTKLWPKFQCPERLPQRHRFPVIVPLPNLETLLTFVRLRKDLLTQSTKMLVKLGSRNSQKLCHKGCVNSLSYINLLLSTIL